MVTTWSHGTPDVFMPEGILVRAGGRVRRHPWWQARARLVLAILDRRAIAAPARILDAGCGWGMTLEALETRGYRASGLDVSRQTLERLDRPDRQVDRGGPDPAFPHRRSDATIRRGPGPRRDRAPRRRPCRRGVASASSSVLAE